MLSAVGKVTFCRLFAEEIVGQDVRRPTARRMHALRSAECARRSADILSAVGEATFCRQFGETAEETKNIV
jgi:hypothetical protein